MRILFSIIILIACLSSCSIEHHLAKAQKHIDIAKRKGALIKPDTVWHYEYKTETVFDTVTNTYKEIHTKDSSFQTIYNTISAGMTRQERLALEDYYKHLEKMMKLQNDSLGKELKAYIKANKQHNKTERVVVRQENKGKLIYTILPWVIIVMFVVIKYGSKILKLWIR